MEYTDQNEYERRIGVIADITRRHPGLLQAVMGRDRSVLERYFLSAATAPDRAEYRAEQIKRDPTLELRANRAYERFLAEAGLPEALPYRTPPH